MRRRGLVASIVLAAYGLAYRFAPSRTSHIALDLEHHRTFAHRWELYFYYAAAFAESRLIHFWPGLYNREMKCPQVVVLEVFQDRPFQFRFHAGPTPAPIEEIIAKDADILDYVLAKYRDLHGATEAPDGSWSDCKYYRCDLDRAEKSLSGANSRPWTISKVLAWYDQFGDDEETRLHLVHLLGATRDPRAALKLGEIMEAPPASWTSRVPSAAGEELRHFIPMPPCGDWPQAGLQGRGAGFQQEWFEHNKTRLQTLCAELQ